MVAVSCIVLSLVLNIPGQEIALKHSYKVGEKTTYSLDMKMSARIGIALDIDTTVIKVNGNGADVKFHVYNKVETGTTRPAAIPEDITLRLAKNALPENYTPQMGSIDFVNFFLTLAGTTSDASATIGKDTPINWQSSTIGFTGSIKLVELMPNGRAKALITGTLTIQGTPAGQCSLTSIYKLSDGSLIQSEGTGGMGLTSLKITRKMAAKASGQ